MHATDTQVVVVGAGLAGLACARELNKHGVDTLVLEARNRIGGRVHTVTLHDGTALDLGAQLIGPRQKRINLLAKEAGAEIIHLNHKGRAFREPNMALSLYDRVQIARLAWRIQKEVKLTPTDKPWLHPNADFLDNISAADWLGSINTGKAFQVWRSVASRSFCLDASQYSALEALQHMSSMGGMLGLVSADVSMLQNGASVLAQHLASEQNIQLNTEVQRIDIVEDKVQIKTNADVISAQQVVLAVPPQIGHKILNSSDDSCVSGGDGTLNYPENPLVAHATKTALVYPTAWWKDNGFSGMGMSETGPVNELYNVTPTNTEHGVLMAISSGETSLSLPADTQARNNMIVEHVNELLNGQGQTPRFVESINWTNESFSMGGYSSLRPFNSWIQQADKPINNKCPIQIAGTESATQWRSYMEGALQSAEAAANNVLRTIKNS